VNDQTTCWGRFFMKISFGCQLMVAKIQ